MSENIELDDYTPQNTPTLESISKKLLFLLNRKNSIEFGRILENHSFDVNYFYGYPHNHNGTLLHIACRSEGNHEIVKILLEHGAESNQVNKTRGSAPIHEAVENADIETLNVLLSDEKCDVNLLDVHERTPVMIAFYHCRADMLSRLLDDNRVSLWTKKSPFFLFEDEMHEPTKSIPNSTTEHTSNSKLSADQIQLLSCFKENLFYEFKSLLNKGDINVNHIYKQAISAENGTILEMACRTKGNSRFVAELINNGAWINYRNPANHSKTPLHTAVQYSDPETLQILLANKICDVNASDHYCNTALHIAVKHNKIQAIGILLRHPLINVNKFDQRRNTPLHLALNLNHKQVIRQLLKRYDIDLDARTDLQDISCRQIISKKYPHLNVESLRYSPTNSTSRELFSFLYNRDTKSFIERAEFHISEVWTSNDGFFTCLQLACDSGLSEVVDKLLAWDVDPNQRCLNNPQTPIMIAAEKGYHEIVRKLLDDPLISLEPINQETVLHSLLRGILAARDDTNETIDINDDDQCDHFKCLEYILDSIPRTPLDVNFGDRQGNTALHYAVKLNDEQIVLLLLNAGSYVCQRNHAGDTTLQSISPEILERYLDSCISTNDESSTQANHQIILNCRIFQPPDDQYQISEIEPLLVLNDSPELRSLLEHPVLTSFLHIKWLHTKIYYYCNVIFFLMFCLTFGSYIFYTFRSNHKDNVSVIKNQSTPVTMTPAMIPSAGKDVIEYLLRFMTLILCKILVLRESLQIYVSIHKYFKSPENWLEIFLIIVTVFLLSCNVDPDLTRQLAASAILAAGFELILLIGRHPSLSTTTEIFKTVTINFLKFLRCYSILILAFAFCSYILYHSDATATANEQSTLQELGYVVIQSFVTLAEPANDARLGLQLNLKHVLFVLSVFFITIVLSSLLNGLAVNDIHKIRKNARLLGIVSRMRCIWYVDTVSAIDLTPIIHIAKKFAYFCCCCCCKRWRYPALYDQQRHRTTFVKILPRQTRLFPDTLPDCMIRILPNDNMAVLLVGVSTEFSGKTYSLLKYSPWRMDIDIVKSSRKILEKRKRRHTIDYQRFSENPNTPESSNIESKLKDVYAAIDELRASQSQRVDAMPVIESEQAADGTYEYVQLEGIKSKIETDTDFQSEQQSSFEITPGLHRITRSIQTREPET